MLSIGLLLSELAGEPGSSVLGGVWPFFLGIFALFACVVGYVACRGPGSGGKEGSVEKEEG